MNGSRPFGTVLAGALLAALTAILPPTAAAGQADRAQPASLASVPTVEAMARAFQEESEAPGLVVGLTTMGGDTILSHGVISIGSDRPVTADTRFEIGSVTKVLTALLAAEMAARGEVDLDAPVSAYLPADVDAPSHNGVEPTLRQISAHTAGLPRLPANLVPTDMADPYAGYTAEAMYDFVSGYDLPRAPGTEYEYSNLGAGLLGHLLASRAGTSYRGLLTDRVLEPLGLTDSNVPGPAESDARMARGHAGGDIVPYWHMGALAAAGGLRSTARDMLRFLRHQLDPAGTALAEAIPLSQEIGEPVTPHLSMALGWHVTRLPAGMLYWHNGGTGGFRSFTGFIPEAGLGVVVLANSAIPLEAMDDFAVQLVRAVRVEE